MEDQNNCPKENCGRPESTHRWSAGKKLSICGNGHSWDAREVATQRAKAKEAEYQEVRMFDYARIEIRPVKRDYAIGGPLYPPSKNSFD